MRFSENFQTDILMSPVILNGGANVPTYLEMKYFPKFAVIVFTGARTGSASLTLQLRQRIGAGGTEKDLNALEIYTTPDAGIILEANATDLDGAAGYDRVGILVTETAGADFVVGAIGLRFDSRYDVASLP